MLLAREATVPKRWNIAPHDATTVASLEKSAGISPILARLLAARGVTDPKQVRGFLDASMSNLREPEELFGIAEAADSILAAAKSWTKDRYLWRLRCRRHVINCHFVSLPCSNPC